jgi:hypothetical protein
MTFVSGLQVSVDGAQVRSKVDGLLALGGRASRRARASARLAGRLALPRFDLGTALVGSGGRAGTGHRNDELTSGRNSTTSDQIPTGSPAIQQRLAPGMIAMLPATDSQ